MRKIEQLLVVGVRVDRRHPALLDAESLMDDFRDRRQTVRRARGVGNDLVLRRVVLLLVDPQDDCDVGAFGRRGDDDFLGAGAHMLGRVVPIGEQAGRLEHHVDAERFPGQLRRIAHRQHLELVAVDRNRVALCLDAGVEVAQNRVVLQQMREGRGVGQVVDRHEIDVLVAERGSHDIPADPAEPVDADPHGHRSPPDSSRMIQGKRPF